MRVFGSRNSAYAVNLTYETYRQHIYIYISREISIEHPSKGLASLTQLFHMHFIASQKKATSNTFHFLNASKSYILDIYHQKGKFFESFNL